MTKGEFLSLLDDVKHVYVGVKGADGVTIYFEVCPDHARRKPDVELKGLTIERGTGTMSDSLYIEAASTRRRR